jgi:hypothetical protein
LVHTDFDGELIWEKTDSFIFDEEDDEYIPSAASEWVLLTKSGDIALTVDLDFGIGLQILN